MRTVYPGIGEEGRLLLDGFLALHDAHDLTAFAGALPRVVGDVIAYDSLMLVGDLGWSAPIVPARGHRIAVRTPGAAPLLLGLMLERDRRFTARETALAALVGEHIGAAADHVRLRERARRAAPALVGLTARERQVLAQVADGRTDRDIAAALHIGARTVEKHVEHIRVKLGTRTRAEAAARWARAAR
ncbi:helix-turn-helix transcriptional regulator [Amnibacterium endophyticum]|uniref:LuxR C-terminal-related transcriptional regulator n=1 Tax=Amnibacterium endophyticum TaxID=2109337 RepID=A0ABW4LE95_9MICO